MTRHKVERKLMNYVDCYIRVKKG